MRNRWRVWLKAISFHPLCGCPNTNWKWIIFKILSVSTIINIMERSAQHNITLLCKIYLENQMWPSNWVIPDTASVAGVLFNCWWLCVRFDVLTQLLYCQIVIYIALLRYFSLPIWVIRVNRQVEIRVDKGRFEHKLQNIWWVQSHSLSDRKMWP